MAGGSEQKVTRPAGRITNTDRKQCFYLFLRTGCETLADDRYQRRLDQLVDQIRASFLQTFTAAEKSALDDLSVRDEKGRLYEAARIVVRGSQHKMIASDPVVVCEGLIKFYTPTEPEACCVLSVDAIEGVYFSI